MFKREQRYIVLKVTDILAARLTYEEIAAFNAVCDKVSISRVERAKGLLECVVVEKDWPEYETTWAAIAKRCASSEPKGEPCPQCNPSAVFNYGDERCELCHGKAYLPPNSELDSSRNIGAMDK